MNTPDAAPVSHTITYIKLLVGMFFWGGIWVTGRVIAQEVEAPLAAAAIRFMLAALVLAAYLHFSEKPMRAPGNGREWLGVIGMGFFGMFIYNVVFFYGLKEVTAGRGALLIALNPVAVALVAWSVGGERWRGIHLVGAVAALIGCLMVLGNGDPLAMLRGSVSAAEWMVLSCVVLWTAYTFLGRWTTRSLTAMNATLFACLSGAVMLSILAVWQGQMALDTWSWRVWACVAFLGIFGTAIGFSWYSEGVQVVGAARSAAFINLVPVFAVIQAAVLLGERLAPSVLVGGTVVLLGVWLTNRPAVAELQQCPPCD